MGCAGSSTSFSYGGQSEALAGKELQLANQSELQANQLLPIYMKQAGLTSAFGPEVQAQYDELKNLYDKAAYWEVMGTGSEKDDWTKVKQETMSRMNAMGSPYRAMNEEELIATMTPQQRLQYQNQKTQQELLGKALRGETEISPALLKIQAQRRDKNINYLANKLGPNWQASTVGQQALANMNQQDALEQEEARQNIISQYTGNTINQQSSMQGQSAQQAGLLGNASNWGSNIMSMYQVPMNSFLAQQKMGYEMNKDSGSSPWGQLAGMVAGTALGSVTGGAGSSIGSYLGKKMVG